MAEAALALTHLQPPYGFWPIRVDRFSPYHFDWESFGVGRPEPKDFYRRVYPESRFAPEEMAYFFDWRLPEGAPDPRARVSGLEEAVGFWRGVWPRSLFASSQGLGFVRLFDTRLARLGWRFEFREDTLTGVEAHIARLCESIRGFEAILASCREAHPGSQAERVRETLDAMVERRWLYREDDQYLFLALPSARLPPEQRILLDRAMRLKGEWLRESALTREAAQTAAGVLPAGNIV
jgi:hypothetical protein